MTGTCNLQYITNAGLLVSTLRWKSDMQTKEEDKHAYAKIKVCKDRSRRINSHEDQGTKLKLCKYQGTGKNRT